MDVQRVLFRFRKEAQARFLSHHDLMRLFERALRRAALPLRMSEGFNPHPRISILLALPLGVEADDEALEVQFEPAVDPAEALERLRAQMPTGIEVTAANALPPGARARVESATYQAELPPEVPLAAEAVERFLGRESIVVERSTPKGARSLDIRPATEWMRLDGRRLAFQLRVGQAATPRPTEVLAELLGAGQAAGPAIRLRRTRLNLRIASGGKTTIPRTPNQQEGTPNAT